MNSKKNLFIEGFVVDILKRVIFPGRITIKNGRIVDIKPQKDVPHHYLLPGLVDAHVHVESSMLTPGGFAQMAVRNGTVAVVSDPHEIANVLGVQGVDFMIEEGKNVPLKFYFGAPSCVPATPFETTGSRIGTEELRRLLKRKEIHHLSEVMNFPGVIHGDQEIMEKIALAKAENKTIDGHAPGLSGDDLQKYIEAGITTDHECTTAKEAAEKLEKGMKILIREGSAAKDMDNLVELVNQFPNDIMLCTDDIHPDDLIEGQINRLLKKGIQRGAELFNLLRAATLNPKQHYNLQVGLLQINDTADLVMVNDLTSFEVIQTVIDGQVVYETGRVLFSHRTRSTPNVFIQNFITAADLAIPADTGNMNVIVARDGELITGKETIKPAIKKGVVVTNPANDLLKICVLNRYKTAKPAVGFIRGMGLSTGAIASSIAHDSHNVIGVGASDEELSRAMNLINELKGGIAVVRGKQEEWLELPVGGIMTNEDGDSVAEKYLKINRLANEMGSTLKAPFMTLSFMSLLVIPELKIGDLGLFDVKTFKPITLFEMASSGEKRGKKK
jgi:adenine deaminase